MHKLRPAYAFLILLLPVLSLRFLAIDGPVAHDQVATAALRLLITEDGFTVHPRRGNPVGAVDAWAVSLAGAEQRFRSLPTVEELRAYLDRHAPHFRPEVYFGGWHDREAGEWVLDLTRLIPERRRAEHFGHRNLQRCIFHLGRKEEVRLDEQFIATTATQ